MHKTVGIKVTQFRVNLGMTQADLAALVGVARVSIVSIETGRFIPTIETALRIGKALGIAKSLDLVFLLSRVLDTTDPNRVLKLYERIGFRRTNLYTVTKGLSNCLMLAGVNQPALQYLLRQGFRVEEARERAE